MRTTNSTRSFKGPLALLVAATALATAFGTLTPWQANATPGPTESTFVPVAPTRILDTRPTSNVGLTGKLVSSVARDLQVTGSVPTAVGTQIVVPTGASGVVLNVTSVAPTAAGFLSVRPADAPAGDPTTSNLNVTTGVTLPNAVTVSLPTAGADAGKIELFFGSSAGATTDILVDVVGYYTTIGLADLTARLPIVASDHRDATNTITANTVTMVNSVTLTVPVAGTISIVGSVYFYGAAGSYKCNLSQGAGATFSTNLSDTDRPLWILAGANNIGCSTNGAISVTPGTYVINLNVIIPTGGGVDDSSLEATFTAGGSITVRPSAVAVEPPAGPGSEQG